MRQYSRVARGWFGVSIAMFLAVFALLISLPMALLNHPDPSPNGMLITAGLILFFLIAGLSCTIVSLVLELRFREELDRNPQVRRLRSYAEQVVDQYAQKHQS